MPTHADLVQQTLHRLTQLYREEGLEPGTLTQVAVKPGWNVVIGSHGQCGMAMNFTGWDESFGAARLDVEGLHRLVGQNLFRVADACVTAKSWQQRSVGVAAVSALSQPLLSASYLAPRGMAVDGPEMDLAHLTQPDDVVAIVGYGGSVQRLLGRCRELHVTDMRPRSAFQTMLIGEKVEFVPAEVIVHPAEDDFSVLERATVVAITGSALVNRSFEGLLQHTSASRLVTAYGASVSLWPELLLRSGVDLVYTYRVSDPVAFAAAAVGEMNMEPAIQRTQTQIAMRRVG